MLTTNYKKYDTYKDSGIEWIGEIPQEWCIRKIKTVSDICGRIGFKGYTVNDLVDSDTNGAAIVLGGTNIMKDGYISYEHLTYISEFKYLESPEIMLHGGEILITKVGAGTGENAIYDYFQDRVTINPNVMLCKPENTVYSKFLNYFLLSPNTKNEIYLESNKSGAQPAINQNYIKNLYMTFPTIEEQQRIADYLDKKCGEIDRVVETEKAVIEKLKEYKQSIITEAVTKGLDKSALLKDSGIEWIGKIPQHWETCKLLKLYKERKSKNKGNIETNVLSLSYGNIKKRNIENNMGLLPESFETYNIIVPDNIVLRLTDLQNDHRSLRCGLVKEQGIITSAYVTLEKKLDNISSNYYYRLLHTFDIMKGFYGMGDGVRQNLKYDGELCNLLVVRPPYAEQQQIAEYLDKKCSEIDKAIADKEQVIEKFTEYKKSLIYECVTGKRKVV